MPKKPSVAANVPGQSIRGRAGCGWLTSSRAPPTIAAAAKKRFTYRHQRQDSHSVSTPPSSRPAAAPEPAIAPKTPNALPRSSGRVNVVASSDSAEGASSAPKTPCSARAPTSTPNDPAMPPIAEATAKPARPTMKVHLRPNRSPRRPPNSSRLPKASAYAVMIHWRESLEKPSSCWADGSAMFTIVASSTTMSWAMPMTARISQRFSWCGLVSGGMREGLWGGSGGLLSSFSAG